MIERIKARIRRTPLITPFIFLKARVTSPRPQNDESVILRRLLAHHAVPRTFIELGFSGWEFNCADLARDWEGLLVDGDPYNVKIADMIWGANVTARRLWLTLDTLDGVKAWARGKDIGILSVDVDGNDFWFLRELLPLRPAIVVAEYNSSFGLRPVTVPYDPDFDRIRKHATRTYYGASLTALDHLARRHAYSLAEVGNTGVNAFFVRDDLLSKDDLVREPRHAFREKLHHDGSRPEQQWERLSGMPFIDVDAGNG